MPDEIELRLLIEAIYLRYSYDFRDYSKASLKRRVRQAQAQLGCPTISALQERILHEPQAFMQLLQYLTIPVSYTHLVSGRTARHAAPLAKDPCRWPV